MNKVFRRFLKNHTQGDEEKELWWWDVFYRYEGSIGIIIAIILTLIVALILLPFNYFSMDGYNAAINTFIGVFWAPFVGGFVAKIIVMPLYETIGDRNVKKENVGQGSLLFATILGKIANFLIHWWPLFLLVFCFYNFKWWLFLGICVFSVIYYMILGSVKPNAKDYVNWRFNWAIENYEMLFSRHYKWWTSAADMSVQKYNLKKFQNYKYNAALALLLSPLLAPPTTAIIFSNIDFDSSHKTEFVNEKTDSISTPDVVENTMIDEEGNVEAEQYESTEPDEYMSQDDNMIYDNQDSEYDDYEERSSQQTTPSNNSAATQSETKPRTEPVTRTGDQTSSPSAAPAREERQAAPQAEQKPKENAGPEFQGGNYALTSYIARHLHYPAVAMEKNIQGKVVVKLTISPTGQVSNAEIVQSADAMLDAEALRLAKSLPRFTPARRNGQPVQSTMTIPINFRL